MDAQALDLTEVTFAYGDRVVLRDVSLSVAPGRLLGLLGPNGAGKSTLVRLAAGLAHPHGGRVTLGGCDVGQLSRRDVARRIAVLPQDASLPATFTAWEIALMGRAPHLGWLAAEGRADRAVAQVALELVGAADYAGRRVGELSGGERQRVLLARALAQEPEVLLLDEPTVHLDPAYQMAMLDLVGSLTRDAGLATLGVFHDINLAAAYCDELAFLAGGQIVARGEPGAVVTAELVNRVYGVAPSVLPHPETGIPVVLPGRQRATEAHR